MNDKREEVVCIRGDFNQNPSSKDVPTIGTFISLRSIFWCNQSKKQVRNDDSRIIHRYGPRMNDKREVGVWINNSAASDCNHTQRSLRQKGLEPLIQAFDTDNAVAIPNNQTDDDDSTVDGLIIPLGTAVYDADIDD